MRAMAASRCKPLVARDQRGVKRFGESHINGVVCGEIVPQFPDARQQRAVRISAEGELKEIGECGTAAFLIDLVSCGIATNHLGYLDVEQVRRMQRLSVVK